MQKQSAFKMPRSDKSFLTAGTNKHNASQMLSDFQKTDFQEYLKGHYQDLIAENESYKNKIQMQQCSLRYLQDKLNLKDRQIHRLSEELRNIEKSYEQIAKKYKSLKHSYKENVYQPLQSRTKMADPEDKFNMLKRQYDKLLQMNQAIKLKQIEQSELRIALDRQNIEMTRQLDYFKKELQRINTREAETLDKLDEVYQRLEISKKSIASWEQKYNEQSKDWQKAIQAKDMELKKAEDANIKYQQQILKLKEQKSKQPTPHEDQVQNAFEAELKLFRESKKSKQLMSLFQKAYDGNQIRIIESSQSEIESPLNSPKENNRKKCMSGKWNDIDLDRKIGGIKNYKPSTDNNQINKLLKRYYKIKSLRD